MCVCTRTNRRENRKQIHRKICGSNTAFWHITHRHSICPALWLLGMMAIQTHFECGALTLIQWHFDAHSHMTTIGTLLWRFTHRVPILVIHAPNFSVKFNSKWKNMEFLLNSCLSFLFYCKQIWSYFLLKFLSIGNKIKPQNSRQAMSTTKTTTTTR